MKRTLTVIATCLTIVFASPRQRADAGTLLYLSPSEWQQADVTQKIALAVDFMRVFCGNPAMPASELVGCLDSAAEAGSMFERALSCIATARRAGIDGIRAI